MANLNDAWLLKYSIYRNELLNVLSCATSRGAISIEKKDKFLSQEVFDIAYPPHVNGPRYVSLSSVPAIGFYDLHDLPDNVICTKLDRKEKLRLFNYYQLDVEFYGKEKN